jgi:hypothetical protein
MLACTAPGSRRPKLHARRPHATKSPDAALGHSVSPGRSAPAEHPDEGFTRTMTTATALETSKDDLPLAVGLGIMLIAIVVVVNALAWTARRAGVCRLRTLTPMGVQQ